VFILVLAICARGSVPEIGLPIDGLSAASVRDTFDEIHSGHPHEATDLPALRGTPVHAVVPGIIRRLFISKPGGNTVYEFDDTGTYCYYYAHLDRYAEGLREGMRVGQGELIGFVGSTGNADPGHRTCISRSLNWGLKSCGGKERPSTPIPLYWQQ
jgi:murein DD-endopeptidase MepM/ murein hydrolase activator NlpD